MFIKKILIRNIGPINYLEINEECLLSGQDSPNVIALVGQNGVGKTTLIGTIVDMFYELQRELGFRGIIQKTNESTNPYFKMSGTNRTMYKENGYSYIETTENRKKYIYIDIEGKIPENELRGEIGIEAYNILKDKISDGGKAINVEDKDIAENDFIKNAYCLFPADRNEYPHWINVEPLEREPQFKEKENIRGILNKPLVARRVLRENKSWLIELMISIAQHLTERRIKHLAPYQDHEGNKLSGYMGANINDGVIKYSNINQMLSQILQEDVRIRPQYMSTNMGIYSDIKKRTILTKLEALSAGQMSLFNIFLTILRYGNINYYEENISDIKGVILIDEADLHLHIDLQKDLFPSMIDLFPKIQFIITTHSPIMLIGMKKILRERLKIIELPTGNEIENIEEFEEMDKAHKAFKIRNEEERKEMQEIIKKYKEGNKPLLLVEGKTDKIHYMKAIEKLGFNDIDVDFKNKKGKGNIERTIKDLLDLKLNKPIIGIYDKDSETDTTINNPNVIMGINHIPYQKHGEAGYTFELPIPEHREGQGQAIIPVEGLYKEEILKREVCGCIAYWNDEVNHDDENNVSGVETKKNSVPGRRKYIYSRDLNENEFKILSKTRFADAVKESGQYEEKIIYESFRPVLETLREIIKNHQKQLSA